MSERPESAPRFSLVIPARNEERFLPRLLDTIDEARLRYQGGASAIEVVVADNASTDRTAGIAATRGCRVVTVETRAIAAVRNAGGRAARGEILGFVDADTRIHPETFNAIDRSISTGKVVAGATGVTLERWSVGLAVTYALMVPFVWLLRMDTGVVFCRRDDFEAVGGYVESLRFAEDVRFLYDLRRLGKRRGQRLARVTSAKAVASTRKFDAHGDWHYLARMVPLMLAYPFSRRPMDDFVQRYWYDDAR